MRCADVRPRRHRRDIRRDREDEARRGRARAGGPDEDRDRSLRGEHAGDDRARRVHEAARSFEGKDDERAAFAVGAIDRRRSCTRPTPGG